MRERYYLECADGWANLVEELVGCIDGVLAKYAIPSSAFHIDQVKEKFGTLRFYWYLKDCNKPYNLAREEIGRLIEKAERQSSKVCEACGDPGKLKYEKGWYFTRCSGCG